MSAITPSESDLVAGFYEAAANPAHWNSAWATMCRAFRADTGMLFQQDAPSAAPRMMAVAHWAESAASPDAADAISLDPFLPALASDVYRSFLSDDIVAPHLASPLDTHPEQAGPDGIGACHLLGAAVPLDGTARAGLGLQRGRQAPAFAELDRATLDRVAPHLGAAMRLERALARASLDSAARGAALDQLTHGAVIIDATGAILFANDAALFLASLGGLMLGEDACGLTCEHPAEANKLARLIANAARGGAGGSIRISRPGMPPLAANISALPVPLAAAVALPHRRGLALAIIRSLGGTSDVAPSELIDLFGLTGAEAAIVPQLLAGDSVSLIAQSRGVAAATVRAQAARVLTKTGAANLRALASMISALGSG